MEDFLGGMQKSLFEKAVEGFKSAFFQIYDTASTFHIWRWLWRANSEIIPGIFSSSEKGISREKTGGRREKEFEMKEVCFSFSCVGRKHFQKGYTWPQIIQNRYKTFSVNVKSTVCVCNLLWELICGGIRNDRASESLFAALIEQCWLLKISPRKSGQLSNFGQSASTLEKGASLY